MRYWIKGEDEDYDREWRRAMIAGDALPGKLSAGVNAAVGVMVALQVIVMLALVALVVDWLRA